MRNELKGYPHINQKIISVLLDFVFPSYCIGCGLEGVICCIACRDALVYHAPSCVWCAKLSMRIPNTTCRPCKRKTAIDGFFAPFFYDGLIRELIRQLKYHHLKSASAVLTELLLPYVEYYGIRLHPKTILIPIPLYVYRERQRGFNQCALIGSMLAERLAISYNKNLLIRTKQTLPQYGLTAHERDQNMQNAFIISNKGNIDNTAIEEKEILLFDDVKTSGATLNAAASVLKKAGARRVYALTIAR